MVFFFIKELVENSSNLKTSFIDRSSDRYLNLGSVDHQLSSTYTRKRKGTICVNQQKGHILPFSSSWIRISVVNHDNFYFLYIDDGSIPAAKSACLGQ